VRFNPFEPLEESLTDVDTLIVWTEPGSQLDIAMSFQDAEGCHDIWSFIIEVQRHLNSLPGDCSVAAAVMVLLTLPGDSAAPSSSSPLSASPMLGVTTQAAINHDRPWQLPTLANIRWERYLGARSRVSRDATLTAAGNRK
jgi:protein phosphatase-4 regulatory subunit 3